jgi:RHS repeat-associated protein
VEFSSPAGSSRLVSWTGLSSPLTYDMLGNLTSDVGRGIYSLSYDYRNLMTVASVNTNAAGAPAGSVVCSYDENEQRTEKIYSYSYQAPCTVDDTSIVWDAMQGGGLSEDSGEVASLGLRGGGAQTDGSGPPAHLCWYPTSTGTYYLYDGTTLVATFDQSDNVIDMFVNGPSGRIATYHQNDDSKLYYYLSDQVGSTRVVMQGTGTVQVAEYYNYSPFGEQTESWGNFATPYQFTSKEHDQNGSFDYVYFGARYYDPRIGAFASVDKAGQFASGYVYGANNPIMGTDRDGNVFFLIPVVLGIAEAMAQSAAYSAIAYTAVSLPTGNFSGKGLLSAIGGGALSGGVAAGLSFVPAFGLRGAALNLMRSSAGSATTSALMGQKVSLSSVAVSAIANAAGDKIAGRFQAKSSSMTKNFLAEVWHDARAGAVSGGLAGALGNGDRSRPWYHRIGMGVAYGALGGGGGAVARNAMYGSPIVVGDIQDNVSYMRSDERVNFNVTFRKGGFLGMLQRSFEEYGQVNLDRGDESDCKVTLHEAYHALQETRDGFAIMSGRATTELIKYGDGPNYDTPGCVEYEAEQNSRRY